MGDRMGIGISYNNLGNLAANTGAYQEAIDFHHKSLAVRREIGDHLGIAQSLLNLGSALDRDRQYDEAESHLFGALKAFDEHGDESYLLSCMSMIARHYSNRGDIESALLLSAFLYQSENIDNDLRAELDECWAKLEKSMPRQKIERAKTAVRGVSLKEILRTMIKTGKINEHNLGGQV